jgi:signal transduction histidine kinase
MLAWNQFNWLQVLQRREEERIQYSMLSSAQALSKRIQEELLFFPSLLHIREAGISTLDELLVERYQFWAFYAISPSLITKIELINDNTGKSLLWDRDHFINEEYQGPVDNDQNDSPARRFNDLGDYLTISMPIILDRDKKCTLQCTINKRTLITDVLPVLAKDSLASTDLYAYRIVDTRDNSTVYSSIMNYAPTFFDEPDIVLPIIQNFKIPSFKQSPFIPGQQSAIGDFESLSFIKSRAQIDDSVPPDTLSPQLFNYLILQIVNRDGSLVTLSRNSTIQNALLSFGVVVLIALLISVLAEATRRSRLLAVSQQEFIATITHELKTPLAVISSAAQNLMDGLIKDQKKAEQYGAMIKKESSRLGVSIEHFLLYSNTNSISRMKPVICDVGELVQTALKFTEEERVSLGFRTDVIIPDSPLFVCGDKIALESAFQNLAQNVLRHAGDGKYLGIVVSSESGTHKDAKNKVIIKFRDKGPGIPPKEQKLIFEPFARGKRAIDGQIPGNGIGLNLVKRIITMHQGTITLESNQDIGSTFILSLPEYKGEIDAS